MAGSALGMMNALEPVGVSKGRILPDSKCCCNSACQDSFHFLGHA